mgnify:CR=1 FL=1
MSKLVKIVIAEGVIILALLVLFFIPKQKEMGKVCFQEKCFAVEVVKNQPEREKGLMNRDFLHENQGMLFVFEQEGNYPFWMKNTLIPLDIIWINENNEIVFIKENEEPCREEPCELFGPDQNVSLREISRRETKYVLEINGGLAVKNGIIVGDKATTSKIDGR